MIRIGQLKPVAVAIAAGVALFGVVFHAGAAEKKILLIAGKQSHGPGDHEFRAGCLLLKKCLDRVPGIVSEVHSNGWPADTKAFDGADAVLIYADGGGGHPAIQGDRIKFVDELVKKGVGVGFAHYGVEVPKGDADSIKSMQTRGLQVITVDPKAAAEFRAAANQLVSTIRGEMVPADVFDMALQARDAARAAKGK